MESTSESSGCRHCGLPLPSFSVRRSAPRGEFCCSGCAVAHAFALRDPEGRTDRWLARVVVSAFLSMGVMVFSLSLYGVYLDPNAATHGPASEALTGIFRLAALALTLPVLLLIAVPLFDAVRIERRWLSADALVVLSTVSAFGVSVWSTFTGAASSTGAAPGVLGETGGGLEGVYFETAALVLTLFGLGRWLETRSKERASDALRELIPERERPVTVVEDGVDRELAPAELRAGQLVRVLEGDVVAVDGTVESGRAFVDTAVLTGEQQPQAVGAGDPIWAGSSLLDGMLLVRAEGVVGERRRDDIERVLRDALRQRSPQVRLADRLAAWLMPAAFGLALATLAWTWGRFGPEAALMRALAVVLIACPCALGIATPLAFWTAIERVWREGALVRGAGVLERLARADRVLFDKTGTLTSGELSLVEIAPLESPGAAESPAPAEPGGLRAEEYRARFLRAAASLERASRHPIARALTRAARTARERGELEPLAEPTGVRTLPGRGIEGCVEGRRWALIRAGEPEGSGAHTSVLLQRDGRTVARLAFAAEVRPESAELLQGLARRGLAASVLTGDGEAPARALGDVLGVAVEARLDPVDKVERVRAAVAAARRGGGAVVFVGDGLNDAPALAAADVGISMSSGAAATLDAADVNLLREGLGALPGLFDAARSAVTTARVNLGWALAYNVLGMALAASGRLTPVFAAAAMVLSSAAVVLNTQRLTRSRAGRASAPRVGGAAGPLTAAARPRTA